MVRHLLGDFELAAVAQVFGDTCRAESMTADFGVDAGVIGAAAGITEYLRNGGKLEIAQQMANHESARTTGLYDRRDDQVSLDEVERILI